MQLTVDEQWMLAYMNTRIHNWGDVKDDASRSIKRIRSHEDFIAWAECFLTDARKEEVKRALQTFRHSKRSQSDSQKTSESPVPIKLNARAARLLVERAREEHCSVSDYLLKKLA